MSFYAAVTGLTTLSYLTLGIIVFLKNPKGELYQRFLIFCSAVAFWALGYFVTLLPGVSFDSALFFSRSSHAVGAFIPVTFFHFALIFLDRHKTLHRRLLIVGYLASSVMFFACFTPLVVRSLYSKMGIPHYPEWGILYPVYAGLYVIYALCLSHFEMARSFFRLHGMHKKRLVFFIVSTAAGFTGGISLFLLIFNLPIPPYASVLIIVFPFAMAYTIIKYREFDIEVIIKKTLVFAGISFFVFGCFSVPLFLIPNVFHAAGTGNLKWWLLALAGMAVAALVGPLNQFLVNVTDKYLFQKKTNYRVLLREATEYLAHVASLRSQARTIVAFFLKKARLANAAVYTFTSRGNEALLLTASRPAIEDPGLMQIDLSHPIVNYFAHHQGPIEIATLKELNTTKCFLSSEDIEKIVNLMDSLKAEAAIPCLGGKVAARLEKKDMYLKAILFLGHQKSDEPYTEEDLDVFFTLGQESSIAFENARLYDEVVERTKLLEQTNTDLSDANEKLKVTQASLIVAEKNATMVGMAKAIGHEVNNPLSTVAGRATWIYRDNLPMFKDVLSDGPVKISPEQLKKMKKAYSNIDNDARKIEHSAKRIEVVVKTLTDILKDTKGEIGPLSLLVLIRETREATRFVTYEENLSGCQIKEDITSNLIVMGNLEQLLQVFVNLIKNAYEAMGKQPDRQITIRGRPDPDDAALARIEVEDNGPGMPAEVLTNIWKQGFTTKVKTSDQIGAAGQGQGLFICKHMIESVHNGSISATSIPGQGTTFVIKLPLADLGR